MVTRRSFLRSASLGTAGLAWLPDLILAQERSPLERIRIGCIGVGNQGKNNLNSHIHNTVAVCDVDAHHLGKAIDQVKQKTGRSIVGYRDYRKLLEDKNVDAVVITVPDHWHALMTIDACAAGKDVYIEKPLTLTIAEGRAMVKAARKYKRIVQTGSQQRSDDRFRQACELVRNGKIGKVHTVRVGIPKVNFRGEPVPDSPPPKELDYDLWLGPAPQRPYNEKRVHYLFRFFWDYSGGQMTNFGAHHLDIAQWGLGMDESGPISCEGQARYHPKGWYEVPEWCEAIWHYANGVKLICTQGGKGGTEFLGDKGRVHVTRGKIEADPKELLTEKLDEAAVRLYVSKNHHANWLECIKSRQLPICDVEIGHRSATVCHLGNIAIRLGRKIRWDPAKEVMIGDADAAAMVSKPYRSPWRLPT